MGAVSRSRVYVHLSYGLDARSYKQRYLNGLEPDETPYGFHLARDEGIEIKFSEDSPKRLTRLLALICDRVLGFDVVHAYTNRHSLRCADAVWTMTENEAFAISCLVALRIIPKSVIVANSVWMANSWEQLPYIRKAELKLLARNLSIMTVHSKACLPVLRKANIRAELTYFGVNTSVFEIKVPFEHVREGPIKIYAPGNDRTRDWDLLLSAFGNDSRFDITLMCPWLSPTLAEDYQNVSLMARPKMRDMMKAYEEADFVAIPMISNLYSGITVALEAVALGVAVLATETGGLPTYFDEKEVLYVPPGDARALRTAVLTATGAACVERAVRAQQRFRERD